jgi:hypothetical protein
MSTGHTTPPSLRVREAGFSIVETLCGMTLMFVGLLSLAGSTVTGMATNETNRESARATCAARQYLESMQLGEVPFEDLFATYAADPSTAIQPDEAMLASLPPGLRKKAEAGLLTGKSGKLHPVLARQFEVVGLEPRAGGTRASMGAVAFPVAEGAEGPELREDIARRDLNGDGVIDSENHAHDYKILPVTVKVEWKGTRGVRALELQTLLIRR